MLSLMSSLPCFASLVVCVVSCCCMHAVNCSLGLLFFGIVSDHSATRSVCFTEALDRAAPHVATFYISIAVHRRILVSKKKGIGGESWKTSSFCLPNEKKFHQGASGVGEANTWLRQQNLWSTEKRFDHVWSKS